MPDDNGVTNPFLSSDNSGGQMPPQENTPPVNPFLVNAEPAVVEPATGPITEPKVTEPPVAEPTSEPESVSPSVPTPVVEAEVMEKKEAEVEAEEKLKEELEDIEGDKNLKEEILALLKQAGIGKGCLLAALLGIVAVIFLIVFFSYDGGDGESGGTVQVAEETEDKNVEEVSNSSEIDSAYQFGESPTIFGFEGGYLSVYGAFAVGRDLTMVSQGFVAYTDLLLQMQNIYEIDLYAMLDGSADRRATLNNHLAVMKDLIERGDIMLADLQQRQAVLQGQFDAASNNKTLLEENFYTSIRSLYGNQAFVYLNSFVEFSKVSVETKAYFNAYKTLEEMYMNSLSALKLRYQDVAANVEALVKGIKVMDIPGSDIKVIIRLGTSN